MEQSSILQPIQSEPAYRLAAQAIREKILSGEIPVGSSLPSEMAMSDSLQVNRSTVREAIRVLEESGMLARKPGGKKLFVCVPQSADVSKRVTTTMLLQKITVRELWEAMLIFEPALAVAAVDNISADQLAALEENLSKTEANLDDRNSILMLDLEFHELIAQASGNRALQLSRQPMGELFYPAFEAVFRRLNTGARLLQAHQEIVAGIRAGNKAHTEEWMTKHIVDFRRGYELAGLDINTPVKIMEAEKN